MVYDARQDKFGAVDLNLQAAWLKHMEDVHPEGWTAVLLLIKEFVSRYEGSDKMPHLVASWHLTCAADALSEIGDAEIVALLDVFKDYLQKKRAKGEAHERNKR